MAFAKKTWKDRIAEFPTRRRLTKEDNTSELVTVAREEGTLSQEGDAFSAENMNDLENRIDAEFTAVNGNLTMHSGSITTDYSVRPILYRANSFEAMVYIDGLKNLTKGKTITIATLPEIARPTGNRIVDATSPSGAYVRISVTASGLIGAYLYTDITPENVIIMFTYIK